MSESRKPGWIDAYPLHGRTAELHNTGAQVEFNPQLAQLIAEQWQPKAEQGWTSSWVAFAKQIQFAEDHVSVNAGAMQFHQIDGMNKAIEAEKKFAPKAGFVPCWSVGFATATSDGNVILQRRGSDVHVPNTFINEPTGYMASMMFAPRTESADPKYASDPRLFDVIAQLDARKEQMAAMFGVDSHLVSYRHEQDVIGTGWLSTELYFSTTGKINVESRHLEIPAKTEIFMLPFEHLKPLILNQGRLAGVDRANHRPDDARQIPLIDESLLALLYGYTELTGDNSLNIDETIEQLNHDGLDIRVYDTTAGNVYDFQTSF